jgi:hypothetical protein
LHTKLIHSILKKSLNTVLSVLVLCLAAFSCNNETGQREATVKIPAMETETARSRQIDTLQREVADSAVKKIGYNKKGLRKTDSTSEVDLSNSKNDFDKKATVESDAELLDVVTEKLLKTEKVELIRPDFIDKRDSVLAVIEERMTLAPDTGRLYIVVEKWQSPVNYRGYKFNRKKVLLYGVRKDMPVRVYFYLGAYYLTFNDRLFYLDETAAHTRFEPVEDIALTEHLLTYEDTI